MRLHGIHLQGLRIAVAERRLAMDSGYNVIAISSPGAREGLAALLFSMLCPDSDLGDPRSWVDETAEVPARAGLAFALGQEAYRLIVDCQKGRLLLGRFDAQTNGYERVSTEPTAVAEHLRRVGLPTREVLAGLLFGQAAAPSRPAGAGDGAVARAAGSPREHKRERPQPAASDPIADRLRLELSRAEEAASYAKELAPRVEELRRARDRFEALEQEAKQLQAELGTLSPLGEVQEGLPTRVAAFREVERERDEERARIDRSRHELLQQRERLRAVPGSQTSWIWLGLALAGSSALAGVMFHPAFHGLALVGAGAAVAALWVARGARRRMGGIEARLAALRVRERAVERHFESEGAPVRSLLLALHLESPEELAREVERHRALFERGQAKGRELEQARVDFPEGADAELRELEERLAEAEQASDAGAIRAELESRLAWDTPTRPELETPSEEPTPRPAAELGLDDVIRAAAAWTGRTEQELRALAAGKLPLYLRSLTQGAYVQLRQRDGEGWALRADEASDGVPLGALPPRQRALAVLALRLALLEGLAPAQRATLLVGPEIATLDANEALALSRALRRISSVTQVVQIASDAQPFADRASRVLYFGS